MGGKEGKVSRRLQQYTRGVQRCGWLIIVAWALLGGGGLYPAYLFLQNLTLNMPTLPGTPSAAAQEVLQANFPMATSNLLIVDLHRLGGRSVLGADTEAFCKALSAGVYAHCNDPVTVPPALQGGLVSYYSLLELGLSTAAARLVSAGDGREHTLVVLSTNATSKTFAACVQDQVDAAAAPAFGHDSDMAVELTGLLVFQHDIMAGVEKDLIRMDTIAFPLAMLVLALVLRSLRLLLIPLLNIGVSVSVSFMLLYPVSLEMDVISFTSSLMMSTIIAMSVDYGLFLLSRYREELRKGLTNEEATTMVLATAGHTISVSGITLAVSFFVLTVFDVAMLRTPGLGAGIAILVALSAALTLTPALLLTFPRFFGRCVEPSWLCWRWEPFVPHGAPERHTLLARDGKGTEKEELRQLRKTRWFKFARLSTAFPWLTLLAIFAIAVPCCFFATRIKTTASLTTITPKAAASSLAFQDISNAFGAGQVFPYELVVTWDSPVPYNGTPDARDALIRSLFPTIDDEILNLKDELRGQYGEFDVEGLTFQDGKQQPIETIADCLYWELNCLIPKCRVSCAYEQLYVTANYTAAYYDIRLRLDPLSTAGSNWLHSARRVLADAELRTGLQFYLAGPAALSADVVESVFGLFPYAVAGTLGFVFLLLLVAFRSLLVPLRTVLSLSLNLAVVYGWGVFVYQYGALAWTGVSGLQREGSMSWLTPIMTFSIVVGLGLDYDVFLLTRVHEYAKSGIRTHNAILYGLAQTGPIITAAGVIMAIAFVGVLFSAEEALNQLSLFLVTAVLMDTFVIRSLVVPSMMAILGDYNWWPSRLKPDPTADVDGEGEGDQGAEGGPGAVAAPAAPAAAGLLN